MRRIAAILALLAVGVVGIASAAGADDTHTYEIEMYNAFGIVNGSDVRISGVNAGTVTDLAITPRKTALVTVDLQGDLATLGTKSTCSAEPQSLIAEYFLTCVPKGPPLPEDDDDDEPDPDTPASRVSQTVQPDLVQNTLREPFRLRLQLLINEFGTALAGNPEALNEAIRLGAPALTETRKATRILAEQNTIIRDLTANSDQVIGELTRVRDRVVDFIDEAEDTAAASASRREDLSRDFALLDDFLAELDPTLAELEHAAREQIPLLADLRGAAPGLNRLALNLPGFDTATEDSLSSLGAAATVGQTALRRSRDEIRLLAEAGRKAPVTAEALADFVRDIDDPRRAVEIDDRAAADTGRTNPLPEQPDTKGYTGFESLLNWIYYLTGTSAQFDQVAHTMHITISSALSGPCGQVISGRDPQTGAVGVPTDDGGKTTNILDVARCAQWLGPNQPGINDDLGLPPYDPAVCQNGTQPAAAEALCSPAGAARGRARAGSDSARAGRGEPGSEAPGGGGPAPSADTGADAGAGGESPSQGAAPSDGPAGNQGAAGQGDVPDELLDDILDLPDDVLDDLPLDVQQALGGLTQPQPGSAGGSASTSTAANDLLDFLFGS
jgi:ABC-type transporter Mla subunit MlaD